MVLCIFFFKIVFSRKIRNVWMNVVNGFTVYHCCTFFVPERSFWFPTTNRLVLLSTEVIIVVTVFHCDVYSSTKLSTSSSVSGLLRRSTVSSAYGDYNGLANALENHY